MELGLKGWIINSAQGVFIDAEGNNGSLEQFVSRLKTDKPKNSFIQSFEHTYLEPAGFDKFEIRKSSGTGSKTALVLPDIATCDDCLKEIFNSSDRRFLYPFTNCTNCGPRFSIIGALPYDRPNTSMKKFKMWAQDTYARARVVKIGRRIANVQAEAWQSERSAPIAAMHGHFLLADEGDGGA